MAERKANKKVFVFPHLDLINCFLKDEAATTCNIESNIVQELILSHYLNSDPEISFSIRTYLFNDDEGITKTGKSLFSTFASLPELVDDTVLPLVDYFRRLEQHYPSDLGKSKINLTHLMRCLDDLRDIFSYYISKNEVTVATDDGRTIKLFDLSFEIKSIDELLEVFRSGSNEYPLDNISHIFDLIIKYWYLPLPDGRLLRNFTFMYRLLSEVMSIAKYPSTPEYRFELVKIVKGIYFSDSMKM